MTIEEKLQKLKNDHTDLILLGHEGIKSEIEKLEVKVKIKDTIYFLLNTYEHVSRGNIFEHGTKYTWVKMKSGFLSKQQVDEFCLKLKGYTWVNNSGLHETILFGYSGDYNHIKLMIPKQCYLDNDLHTTLKNILNYGK